MFEIRARTAPTIEERQHREIVEIAPTTGDRLVQPLSANWHERWCTLPGDFRRYIGDIYNFEVRDDDVFVITFPKSGTTWVQEAVWLLVNDLNYDQAQQVDLQQRSVFMDLSGLYNKLPMNTVKLAREARSPRVLKSHLPAPLLPQQIWQKKTKIVYCARNLKDVTVSYYHFHRGLGTWQGNIDEFVEDLIHDDIMYSPYWPHILDFWQMREEKNIFFVTFEDMKRDLVKVLRDLCEFLEKPALTEHQMNELVQHLSFEKMKDNIRTNPTKIIKEDHGHLYLDKDFEFMRRGIVGSFRDELSAENQAKLQQMSEPYLKAYDLTLNDIFGTI